MPILDGGFRRPDGHADENLLVYFGPTTQVVVGHMAPDDGQPTGPTRAVYALIDTGAAQSCIDENLAQELGLPVIDRQRIAGAGGASVHDVYLGHIAIPKLEIVQYGRFTGVGLAVGGQEHKVLLGRTFLGNVVMIYDGIRAQVTIACQRVGT